ncbi:hypothetical protein [Nocardia huaxiensis]|uniref:hypothetical protein n=1 Tax=Nocardia huaxiensis TaxID=2755382 RepID=UPI001E5FC15C|nr:hypothetical protein [Nocardia huaxiensis]UFS97159.1 hypothetical protein LPY97_04315 [Nocardia huaxiensis]
MAIIIAAGLVLFGPMEFTSEDRSLLAPALTFSGVVVTACVTAIGLILNHQATRRLEQSREDEHNRLRLDAAMRAGQLLASDGTRQPNPEVVASGLLALTKLDQVGLAVTLLVDLWTVQDSKVSSETAILVIDAALCSERQTTQLVAAEILCRNATRLNACQSLHWPSTVEGNWDPGFSPRTKLLIVEALITMTMAGPPSESAIRAIAVRLYSIWDAETQNPHVRGCIGKMLKALVPRLERLGYTDFVQGNREVLLRQMCTAAADAATNPDGYLDQMSTRFAGELARWSEECTGLPSEPGSLAHGECGAAHAA